MNVVPTNVLYNSYLLRQNLILLNLTYPFLNLQVVGNSILGKPIYVVKLGKGPNKVFYSGSIHANEWITSVLLMKFLENLCTAYLNRSTIWGYPAVTLFNNYSLYVVPMVNPDGVDLVVGNTEKYLPNVFNSAKSLSANYPSIPFPSGWKANINGVDLKNYQPFCRVL